jgi:hypothetical protein
MVKEIRISDAAYSLLLAHANANGESQVEAMDELFSVADQVWMMDMPEMKTPWAKFRQHQRGK